MRDGPMLSCAGLAEEPASAVGAVTDCLPPAFVDCLLDSALEPVLDAAAQRGAQAAKRKKNAGDATEVAKALLTVTVCDPACGSGSLLVAAARRIARRVAEAREGNQSPDALRRAMREVVGSCVYGVDVSGEAVERAKDRLRIAADVPGMTPPFLDGHVRPGNALIGASPELIESGVPDEAFRPADGDDRGHARSLRRANAKPDPGQATLFSEQGGYAHSNEALAKSLAKIGRLPGGASADDRRQAAEYRKWRDSAAFGAKRLVADAWCAAFAWAKTPDAPPAIVNRVLLDLRERGAEGILPETLAEIYRLRGEHRFFHWHLEFPDVFRVVRGRDPVAGRLQLRAVRPATGEDRPPRGEHGLRVRHRFGCVSRMRGGPGRTRRVGAARGPALRGARYDDPRARGPRGLRRRPRDRGRPRRQAPARRPDAARRAGVPVRLHRSRRPALPAHYRGPAHRRRPCLAARARGPAHGGAARFAFWLDGPAGLGDDGRSFTLTPDEAAAHQPEYRRAACLPRRPGRGARDGDLPPRAGPVRGTRRGPTGTRGR